ncbi:hypothetical protein L0P88_13875 [Muricauda sp. SCSIO 64092]|uniref:hypothetical protein n=1 Tax=Allomuricauda sp. SCSIO 64092 TaxID=2908842 RepID=UPI001FF37A8A|nr:hypothetical protein [Muricauda sp. SCSIO 64092]UOY05041.1 hypothetical protein L0P88_13875 [Muricauda sp. SCSIO 64092]
MKKTLFILVVSCAFVMTAYAQNDVAVLSNSDILNRVKAVESSHSNENKYVAFSNEDPLSRTNKADFARNHSKKAKELSKTFVNGKIVALKKGYTYKQKFHWLIMIINVTDDKIDMYAFTSNTNFTGIRYQPFDKTLNFRNYILENY